MIATEIITRFAELMRRTLYMKVLFIIFFISGVVTIAHVDPMHPLPNYIGLLLYLMASIAMVAAVYSDMYSE